ncbi:MAG: hypothetical protein U1E27_00420 [Kiritimatiellia bacterium]|nr:hypothetical protein [Kiritimatiellia bacterium]
MRRGWLGAAFLAGFGILSAAVQASPWRAVAVEGPSGGVDFILEDGTRYPGRGASFPISLAGKEVEVRGRMVEDIRTKPPRTVLQVERVIPAPPFPSPVFVPAAPGFFAGTDRRLPEDQLRPGGRIELECPELGTSASSDGKEPIRMVIDLPSNYRRETRHPVIVHFGGGKGGARGVLNWRTVVGPKNFILLGADYDFEENTRREMLKIGTCRDFDSKIALTGLQMLGQSTGIDLETILLAGFSSGAFSITDNLTDDPKPWQAFAGFCAIGGGAGTGQPKLGNRSVLFLMGEEDAQRRHGWLQEAVDALGKVRGNRVTVHKFPGVGHKWDAAMTPAILEWLKKDFPAMVILERRRELRAAPLSPAEAQTVIAAWMERSGLE